MRAAVGGDEQGAGTGGSHADCVPQNRSARPPPGGWLGPETDICCVGMTTMSSARRMLIAATAAAGLALALPATAANAATETFTGFGPLPSDAHAQAWPRCTRSARPVSR